MAEFIGAIDQGTTSTRFIVFTKQGTMLSSYQKEIVNNIIAGKYPIISENILLYFKDIRDHLVRVSDLAESYREHIISSLDAFLTVSSNRLNEVMKVLTIISTIILPLTFVTGIYGMNFIHMPFLNSPFGFWIVTGLMFSLFILMLFIFRIKKWI